MHRRFRWRRSRLSFVAQEPLSYGVGAEFQGDSAAHEGGDASAHSINRHLWRVGRFVGVAIVGWVTSRN